MTMSKLLPLCLSLSATVFAVSFQSPIIGAARIAGTLVYFAPRGWEEAALAAPSLEPVQVQHEGQTVTILLPRDNQGGAAASVFLPPFGTGAGADQDNDGILDSAETALAERFAPIIVHDKQDRNLPTSVDWLLARTALEYFDNSGRLGQGTHVPIAGRPLTQQDLLGKTHPIGQNVIRSDGTRSKSRKHTFALLDLQPPIARQGSLDSHDWRTYVHAFRNYYGGVTIQYWRAYAFNTGDQAANLPIEIDHHGGDWEGVHIVLDNALAPVNYRFMGHTDIDVVPPDSVNVNSGHAIVYSEPGGHASHASHDPSEFLTIVGLHWRIWVNDLRIPGNTIRQQTWDGGLVTWPNAMWRGHVGGAQTSSGGLLNLGEKVHPLANQVFVRYSGLWGSLGTKFSGYWGPAFNETQMEPDGFITAWCYGMKASRSNVTALRDECYPAASSD